MKEPRYYLAYGMNTDVKQMAYRCPTAVKLGRVRVHHHQLVFRGVADVIHKRGNHMWCALWTITPKDEAALDRLEGFPYGYGKTMLTVTHEGKQVQAMIYFMQRTSSQCEPGSGYEQMLRDGYKAFGMPSAQIDNAISRAQSWSANVRQFDRTDQQFA